MSAAVDALSAQYGTLFVIASGNAGPETIGSPGAAASAGPHDQAARPPRQLSGLTDHAIAGSLTLSARTVQRRIRHLMDLAGVDTRVRLGWYAARKEWAQY